MAYKDKEKERANMKIYRAVHREELRTSNKRYREEHCEELRTKRKKYYDEHHEEMCDRSRKWRNEHLEKERANKLMHNHGITIEEYDKLLAAQNGICVICGLPPNSKKLSVDHNHETGKIRGLLCKSCNRALGLVYESVDILAKMINYLETRNE